MANSYLKTPNSKYILTHLTIKEKMNVTRRGSETVRALVRQIIDSSFSVRNDSFLGIFAYPLEKGE
ncbi:hypothetical protein CN404_06515 [Bacillus thuringiensis]|nr:hypothetical protein CN404_06515 [Bacillus thuringiensis]